MRQATAATTAKTAGVNPDQGPYLLGRQSVGAETGTLTPLELDETGVCYFAALIYGLSLINEKEADLGHEFGSTEINADALVHFVRRKGDKLVALMIAERGPRLCWDNEEMGAIIEEAQRRGFNPAQLTDSEIKQAQIVLPPDRRKIDGKISYSVLQKVRGSAGRNGHQPIVRREQEAKASPAIKIEGTGPDDIAALIAQKLVAVLVELNAKALELAAEQLRQKA